MLGALLLGGCGGGGDGDDGARPATTATVAPADGTPIAGSGYELRAAKGWNDIEAQAPSSADVILATESGSVMNVLREKLAPGTDRGVALEALSRSILQAAGATRRSASTPTALDGADGVTFGVRIKTEEETADGRVVIVIHEDHAYAIAATRSPSEPVSIDRAIASMLSTWRWT